jgi:hypothetical protein
MSIKVNYRNRKFVKEKVLLDGHTFKDCHFKDCIIILEKGDTAISGCRFENCKLMLQGNAYTIARIIKQFTGESPLKVIDIEEPWIGERNREGN